MNVEYLVPGGIQGYDDLEQRARESYEFMQKNLIGSIKTGELNPGLVQDDIIVNVVSQTANEWAQVIQQATRKNSHSLPPPLLTKNLARAVHAGIILGRQLVFPDSWGLRKTTVDYIDAPDERYEQLIWATNRYIRHRPALNELVAGSTTAIVKNKELATYLPHTRRMAQLTLMQTEAYMLHQYKEITTAQEFIRNWDGSLPGWL